MGEDTPVKIGRVTGAHGIKGEVNVRPYTETDVLYDPGGQIHLICPGGGQKIFRVADCRPYRNILRITLAGVTDRKGAEALKGAEIFVLRRQLPEIEEPDSWYWSDLIGLEVYDIHQTYIGRLEHIFTTGANDVFVVRQDGKEILIPAVEPIVRRIDPESGHMVVAPPEGL